MSAYNCGHLGCMRCGNIPTPEQQAELDARHEAKMQANAEASARYIDRIIYAEVYKQVMETVAAEKEPFLRGALE